jgi:CS domain
MTEATSDVEREEKLKAEATELAKLPYKWKQTLPDLDLTIKLPKGTRGRDLVVKITKQKVYWND